MTEYRAIQVGEEPACIDLWKSVFRASQDYFPRYFADPHWKPDYTRVCAVEGQLVAAVQIVRRWVHVHGEMLPMAGIANVATLPEHRGKGHSTRLLKEANAVMDTEDFLFGLLFTGIQDFYARLGWSSMPGSEWIAPPSSCELPEWIFREAQEEDIPRLAYFHSLFSARLNGTVHRDQDYWREWVLMGRPEWRQGFYLVEREGEIRGYLRIKQYPKRDEQGQEFGVEEVALSEVGVDPSDSDALQAIIGFAIDGAYRVNADRCAIDLPNQGFESLIHSVSPQALPQTDEGAMVRLCSYERLLNALERVAPDPVPVELIPADSAKALRLLLGGCEPNDDYPEPLPKFFPPRPMHYWNVDGF